MRLIVTGFLVLASSSAALAADCADGFGTTISSDKLTGSFIFTPGNNQVSGGSNTTCTISADMPLPSGSYGVYKVDTSGSLSLEAGETATYTVTYDGGAPQALVYTGEAFENVAHTSYFGTGLVGTSGFNAEFDLSVDGAPASEATTESVEVLAGYTTWDSQIASLENVSIARTGIVTALNTTAGLVLGTNQPVERPTEMGLLGALGSATVGGFAHVNLDGGFSLDAGITSFTHSVDGQSTSSGLVLGGQGRYVAPDSGSGFRWLASAGVNYAPELQMGFTRSYSDGSLAGTTTTGSASGSMVGIWLEGGVLVAPTPTDEIVFSASIGRNWLNTVDYAEELGGLNLFALSSDDATSTYDTIKAKAAWTTEIAPEFDLTLHGAVGYLSANDGLTADIAFVDTLTVGGQSEAFVEYGARLGWAFAEQARWDVFALGSTGAESGTHVQVGTAVSMKF